ncbi:acyl-[acyl-carrier-protein] thioesterase [Paenibacillus sp. 79R4]|nr:acyl-[acyl-carrier-protein] thioesterase [Paenibacillus sp. 79R4]
MILQLARLIIRTDHFLHNNCMTEGVKERVALAQHKRESHDILSDHCDSMKRCRVSTLLSWLQRIADEEVARLGLPTEEMMQQGMAWMLTTIDVELPANMPCYGDKITLESWHKGHKGVQWLRDFRIYGKQGERMGQARSIWILVDLEKRRILRPSALPREIPADHEDSVGDAPQKVQIPEGIDLRPAYDYTVRQSSIDMNGHVNNAQFASLGMDALSAEQFARDMTHFRITYHQEAMLGETITILTGEDNEQRCWISSRTTDDRILFEAELEFKAPAAR